MSAFAPIVATLRKAHLLNVYHCDVAPENLLAVDGSMLLNDFGNAVMAEYIGGIEIATRRLYYDPPTFGAASDLCTFVRSAFYLTQKTFDRNDGIRSCQQIDEIVMDLTQRQLSFWKEALRLTKQVAYDELHSLFFDG